MQLSDSRKSVEEKCQSSSSRHTRTGIIIAFPFTVRKLQPMGSRDKPYGVTKTLTKEIGRGRFTRNLQRLEERRPEFRMQRLQLGSLAAVSLPLNPCLRTPPPPPQERESEIHQRTSHPNISRSLPNSQTKKISWTQRTWISRGSKQQQDQQVSSQVWQGLGFRVLECQQSIVHLQLNLYMELWSCENAMNSNMGSQLFKHPLEGFLMLLHHSSH